MSDFAQNLERLVALQGKDSALDALRARLESIPEEKAALSDGLEQSKAELNAHRERQKKLALRHKELERQLSDCEEQIRKHQAELNQVKSNDAFKALLSEIETGKKRAGELETEILSALDDIESAAAHEKKLAGEFKIFEDDFNSRSAALDSELQGVAAALKLAQARRDEDAAGVEPSVLEKYEHIRKQRGGLAVCAIKAHGTDAACSGCNMALRPQALVAAKKKGALTQCDNCQRILYCMPEAQ